jgi:hypothetical protein
VVGGEAVIVLTLVLLRMPLEPSIQMYSANTLFRWSSFMYLANCYAMVRSDVRCAEYGFLTLAALETMVDSACVSQLVSGRSRVQLPHVRRQSERAHHDGLCVCGM